MSNLYKDLYNGLTGTKNVRKMKDSVATHLITGIFPDTAMHLAERWPNDATKSGKQKGMLAIGHDGSDQSAPGIYIASGSHSKAAWYKMEPSRITTPS